MLSREELVDVFKDTLDWIELNQKLSMATDESKNNTEVFFEDNYPDYVKRFDHDTKVTVTKYKSFQAARRLKSEYPGKKIAVLNFANPEVAGGGVALGAKAQEESLCRASTLYPVIASPHIRETFYEHHRELDDPIATDSLIYSKDIVICKTDDDIPKRLPEDEWVKVDVITMAAPRISHYGEIISDERLYDIHVKRATHMLTVAAHMEADILVLGAFGCGAFNNNPDVVSKAYREVLRQFNGAFEVVEFAIYCASYETNNYTLFNNNLSNM